MEGCFVKRFKFWLAKGAIREVLIEISFIEWVIDEVSVSWGVVNVEIKDGIIKGSGLFWFFV